MGGIGGRRSRSYRPGTPASTRQRGGARRPARPAGVPPVPGPGGYSYRSASMVLRPAARLAGQSPKKRPTPTENPNATATATGET